MERLIKEKQKGKKITINGGATPAPVIDLIEALKRSMRGEGQENPLQKVTQRVPPARQPVSRKFPGWLHWRIADSVELIERLFAKSFSLSGHSLIGEHKSHQLAARSHAGLVKQLLQGSFDGRLGSPNLVGDLPVGQTA